MADTTNDTATQAHDEAADTAAEARTLADNGHYAQAGEKLEQAEAKLAEARDAQDVDKLRETIARLEADNRKLKDENGERRVAAKKATEQAETLRKVAQALGLEPSDDDPEVQLREAKQAADQRAKERDELQAELNRLRADARLRTLADKAGADADMLVPLLRGLGEVPEWGADDWDSKATQIIADTIERYPNVRGVQAPRSSGNAPTPTNSHEQKLTREDLQRLAAEGKFEEINQLAVKHGLA